MGLSCQLGLNHDKGPEEVFVAVALLPSPALSFTTAQAVTASPPPASLVPLCLERQGRNGELLRSAAWWGWWAGEGGKDVAALVWQLHEECCFQPA